MDFLTNEQFDKLLEFLEKNKDPRTALAESLLPINDKLSKMAFNSNGADINGCQSHYKALSEQTNKILEAIELINQQSSHQ